MVISLSGRPSLSPAPVPSSSQIEQLPSSEVAVIILRMNLLEDLYVTMPAIGRNQEITLRAAVNPLLAWIWIGSFVMLIGGVMAVIPRRRKREVESDYE